jgi:CubicO group peptidase (beta-lactamase class C family)
VPLSPNTLFQAGSVSKPVSSLAYLMADFADATLAVDIRPTVVGLVAPPYPITPADLLSHTAGTTVHGFGGYAPGLTLPTVDQIVQGMRPANSPAVGFGTPGSYDYSGGGYMLWNAWLERRAGASLPNFVRDTLLVPAGATRSSYQQPIAATEHDAACGYDSARLPGYCRNDYPEYAAAGLWTTPHDLTCIAGYVATRRPDALTRVTSRSVAIPSYPQRQGLGLRHRPANGTTEAAGHFYEHSGVNYGFCTQLLFFTDGRAIATMDNACRGVSYAVASALCRELGWSCAGASLAAR